MTDSTCRLVLTPAREESCSVRELVQQKATESKPLLAWAEPDPLCVDLTNGTGRREGFRPLVCGMPSWSDAPPLCEARLFWADSALHIVAGERGGCAWVRIAEAPEGGVGVARSEIAVHTVQDHKRFGLQGESKIEGLRAVEYRQRGRLVAWRLVIEEK